MSDQAATKHTLIFYENRNTPKVIPVGGSFSAPKSYGKETHRRPATAAEEKKIASGAWLRVDSKGNTPGDGKYQPGSNLRPAMRKKVGEAASLSRMLHGIKPVRGAHGVIVPQTCPPCTRTFVDAAAFAAHMGTVHSH